MGRTRKHVSQQVYVETLEGRRLYCLLYTSYAADDRAL